MCLDQSHNRLLKPELQDLQGPQDSQDHQDRQGLQEGKDPKDRQGHQEGKDHKDLREDKDHEAQQALAIHKVGMKAQEG